MATLGEKLNHYEKKKTYTNRTSRFGTDKKYA